MSSGTPRPAVELDAVNRMSGARVERGTTSISANPQRVAEHSQTLGALRSPHRDRPR